MATAKEKLVKVVSVTKHYCNNSNEGMTAPPTLKYLVIAKDADPNIRIDAARAYQFVLSASVVEDSCLRDDDIIIVPENVLLKVIPYMETH